MNQTLWDFCGNCVIGTNVTSPEDTTEQTNAAIQYVYRGSNQVSIYSKPRAPWLQSWYLAFHNAAPTCEMPDNRTLNEGHQINTSNTARDNRLLYNTTVTLTCAAGWKHPNRDSSRSFVCTGLNTFTPAWTACYCKFIYIFLYILKMLRIIKHIHDIMNFHFANVTI